MNVSIRRASLGDMYAARSKSFTSPAMRHPSPDASKRVMGPMPERPASSASQDDATSLPTGLTAPSPVTTTRRRPVMRRSRPSGLLQMGVDVVDRLLDRADLLGLFVGNLALELVFEGHHQLDGVERIRAQVLDECGLVLDVRFVHAQLLGDDLLDALFDVFHYDSPPTSVFDQGDPAGCASLCFLFRL